MGKAIIFLFSLALLVSCKKDQTPEPCTSVSMAGEREMFVGTWRWYSTVVEEWFDLGPSIQHDYTPQNQGFEYYFVIDVDGTYKGYRDNVLVDDFLLSSIAFEIFGGTNSSGMDLRLDCGSKALELIIYSSNIQNDSLHSPNYPLSFDDQENHLIARQNFFVKQ
ncbi:MAG: hypothetical protein QNK23_00490 [Crocinitomicaceae bacterium]|nr:hypothetical protein [Crocinitomicaceae bacterium]